MTADGAVWYVETGEDTKNVLVRFNPVTKKVLTWPIPGGGGTVRNMEHDQTGNLWMAESGRPDLARDHEEDDEHPVGRGGQGGRVGRVCQ